MNDRSRYLDAACLLLIGLSTGCQSTNSSVHLRPRGMSPRLAAQAVASVEAHQEPIDKTKRASRDASENSPIIPVSAETPIEDDFLPESLDSNDVIVATGPITLAQLEELAQEHNPAILQATAIAHKAEGFRCQVGLSPNPTVGYNAMQLADRGTDQHTGFVEQEVVTGDKLQKNRDVLRQEVQTKLLDVETQRYRVLTDLRQLFYTALAAQRRMELALDFERVANEGVRVARLRFDAKEGAKPEILQAEIQLNQILMMRQQAEIVYHNAWKQMVSMVGLPDMAPRPLEGELGFAEMDRDWEATEQKLLAVSPELQAAQSRLTRAQLYYERQLAQAIPNVTLYFGAGKDYATNQDFFVNTQVGLPLPIYNRNQGNITAANAELVRASQNVERIGNSIKSRLAKVRSDYDVARVAVERYQSEILPRASETLELAEKAYDLGEFNFFSVYLVRRTYLDTNLDYVNRQLDLRQANALVDGLLLTGGLDDVADVEYTDGLRDQTFSQQ
ncbi:MAG: TolC family protein [Planctomycetota bacterium]|nr:TolC family protein [Planctomycetota bacterium]MDA1210964.1 TolC family protein [Planctomycetota bacterium]